ncbi:MAG: DUF2298 domain-containing protein, partial [Thermomicrobiales bacterium]
RQEAHVGARTIATTLFGLGLLLVLGTEFFFIRDVFQTRMNTLFKFYYQAWTLYAVAAAISVALLWTAAVRIPFGRAAVGAASVMAVVAGFAYPIVASYQWTEHFDRWRGLDGLAYAEEISPDEVAAIRWLARNAQTGDVVLEAAGCSYLPFDRLPFNRVSAFTGIPTVIGWAGHERQWRAGQPAHIAGIDARQATVSDMYADPSSPLFADHSVDWLFVGDYERGDWRSECDTAGPYEGLAGSGYPGPGWQEAFRAGDVSIYRRTAE